MHAHTCRHAHTLIDMLSPPQGTLRLPFLYVKLWKNDDPDAAWDRVDFGKNMDLGPIRAASVHSGHVT